MSGDEPKAPFNGSTRESTRSRALDKLVARLLSQAHTWPEDGYLVGGSVRDTLVGRESKDFDWVVPDPGQAARKLARAQGGTPFEMDAERRHWRVALASGATHDFAPLREGAANISADLRLRDLTINALAVSADGQLIDPLGGRADLAARVVRMTSLSALSADPVRPLRAVRLATTLGFRIEEQTLSATAQISAAQAEGTARLPAFERVGAELNALMAAPRAAQGFNLLSELGMFKSYLPELEAARGVHQGRGFHHLDVLGHSLEALNQLLHGFPGADHALRWATLLHDVGKPLTFSKQPFGRVTFYGHDKAGASLAARALRRLRMESSLVDRVVSLVRYHMLPLPRGERAARRFVHRRRALLPDLLKLMIADREAARGPLSSEAGRQAYRVALGQVISLLNERPAPQPLLTGKEVMELLGIAPGPRVGEALALVAEAHAVGDIEDVAGARALLLRYARVQGW